MADETLAPATPAPLFAEATPIGINFPFVIRLQHGPIGLTEMFELTKAFDLYEMEKDLSDQEGLVKENILVDVLECTPTETTIKVTPAQSLPYDAITKHVQLMVVAVTKRLLKGRAKVVSLKWEIDKTGVASDIRGMLRKVL